MSKEGVKCPVSLQRSRLKDTRRENNLWTGRLLSVSDCRRGWSASECSQSSLTPTVFRYLFHSRTHWRQPRRGCRGHIPPNILVGGTSTGISPPILLRTFGYSRPILVALCSLSLKPFSFGYKTPPIRFSQAGGQSAHKARPPQP